MKKSDRAKFIAEYLNRIYPETPIPLDHRNAYTLLIAVLLSGQCTDVRVNQVTPQLFKLADNATAMKDLPVEKIEAIIRSCGTRSPQVQSDFPIVPHIGGEICGRGSAVHGSLGSFTGSGTQNRIRGNGPGFWNSGIPSGYLTSTGWHSAGN